MPSPLLRKRTLLVVIGEEQIVQPIIVVIADGDAGDPAGTREAGFRGDIEKRSIAIVFVQPVAGAGRSGAEARATQDQNIEPAIVIVIEERDAATDGFEDMMFGVDGSINAGSGETGCAGDIGKLGIERQAGALGRAVAGGCCASPCLARRRSGKPESAGDMLCE